MSDRTRQIFGYSFSRAGITVAALVAFNVVLWVGLATLFFLRADMSTPMVLAGATIPLQFGLLLTIGSIRTIAKHTFFQCVRMKIALAFMLLLMGALILICTQMQGDGTLAGRIRTLLSYGVAATTFLLSIVTVFLAAGLVSNDVRNKTIFSTDTKPLPRWQYVLGRWLGLVGLNAVLLVPAGGAIYGAAQYLRHQNQVGGTFVEAKDRLAVETEIFVSRKAIRPKPLNVEQQFMDRMKELAEDPEAYARVVEDYRRQNNCDLETARAGVEQQIRDRFMTARQTATSRPADVERDSVWPVIQTAKASQVLRWEFEGIELGGKEVTGVGTINDVREDKAASVLFLVVHSSPQLVSRLTYGGPVRIDDHDAIVQDARKDVFAVVLLVGNDNRQAVAKLTEGKAVEVAVEPTVQVVYKGNAIDAKGDDTIHGLWRAINPTTNRSYLVSRDDPPKVQSTLNVPLGAVDDSGKLELHFINRSPASVQILHADMAVMYPVATFESNFLRAMAMVLLQVAFIAAIGIWASTFLSYPVACLATFALMPLTLARSFLVQATIDTVEQDFWVVLGGLIMRAAGVLMPDFGGLSPSDAIMGGVAYSWAFMGQSVYVQLAVRTLLVLALACAIFRRRELAQVQV